MMGVKFDDGKLQWSLIPQGVMEDVVRVLMHGAKKYGRHNWTAVPNARERYFNAAIRHITKWYSGSRADAYSKKSHLAHAICCLMFLMWLDAMKQRSGKCKN